MKKTGGKKVSSTLKKLIEELLTNDIVPVPGESLEETNVTNEAGGIFLQLFNRINNAETKMHLEVSFSVILILGKLYINDTRS